jgi:hypothetical protein
MMQIEDIKAYFDDPGDSDDDAMPGDELEGPEMLLYSRGAPCSREELLAHLPERHVMDRIITRYFSSKSPSQRQYFVSHPYLNRAHENV